MHFPSHIYAYTYSVVLKKAPFGEINILKNKSIHAK